MRSLNLSLLVAIFFLLALGNVFVTAQRSLIPLAIDAEVVDLEMRREKHPGKDDVYLLTFSNSKSTPSTLQIDQEIAHELKVGNRIKKAAWQDRLNIDDRALQLQYSSDFVGMIQAMPVAIIVAIAVVYWQRLWSLCIRKRTE